MKKYLVAATLLICSCQLSAQKNTDDEPYSVKKFTGVKITSIIVETTGGNISVVGDNVSDPRVEMFVEQNGNRKNSQLSKEEIKQRLASDYEINISTSGNRLTATAHRLKKNERDWEHALNISFKLFVPQNTGSDLQTSGGNISLLNLTGTQDFKTSGGNLIITRLSGNITGKTSGGNIKIRDSKDNIDVSTSGGNIDADNCSGKINLTTSGGNLEMAELKGDIHAHTSGGNVHGDHISGDISTQTSGGSINLKQITGSVDASTSAGNIDLSMVSVTKKISLSNSSGSIYLELPKNAAVDLRLSADNIKTNTLGNFKGEEKKDRIEGSINGGGILVRASANSGTIRLMLQ